MIKQSLGIRYFVLLFVFLVFGVVGPVQAAFSPLNLTTSTPDIVSAFITVDYIGNTNNGQLTAVGFAQAITPPGSPAGDIAGGSFDISANIQESSLSASGSLNIGGTVSSLAYNSGTLLTGTLSSMGGLEGVLEFLFEVTGGDAAAAYGGIGSTAGVILSQSGYTVASGFSGDFSSNPFGARADTFGAVPEPGTLVLFLIGGIALSIRQRTKFFNNLNPQY